jgi:hypothetical protein
MNLGFEGYVPPEKSVSKEGARSQNPGVRRRGAGASGAARL